MPDIHPTAIIESGAQLADGVTVGAITATFDGLVEQIHICVQRELVHWVNSTHVVEDEICQRSTNSGRAVAAARQVDLDFRFLGDLELLSDLFRGDLTRL